MTDILINSPNLSPIKENSLNNLSIIDENKNIEKNETEVKKVVVDMDIDIGGIFKASVIPSNNMHNSTTNNLNTSRNVDNFSFMVDKCYTSKKYNREFSNNLSTSRNVDNYSFFADTNKKYNRELSNNEFSNSNDLMNTSKPFTVTNLFDNNEITTNQDQDTGYQTGGSSSQFNIMMDITNSQEKDNSIKSQFQKMPLRNETCGLLPPTQHPKKSLSLNFDSIKMIESFTKEAPNNLNLPSFVELCPLGNRLII